MIKFISMELEPILNDFECYRKIQEADILDSLLTDYLRTHELNVSDGKPNQGREVRLMRGKPDLSSRSVIFHEKCEIALYLDFGYSEKDIRSGVAHSKSYEIAHDIAEKMELQLLQHVAKASSGKELPLFVIFPARPSLQLFDPELEVISSRMGLYLPKNTAFGLYAGIEEFIPLEFKPDEVQASFEMFERFGSEYFLQDFKERCVQVVRNFVRRTNMKYKSLQESMCSTAEQARFL